MDSSNDLQTRVKYISWVEEMYETTLVWAVENMAKK